MIEVERYGGTEEEWDEFATAQDGVTHFHQFRWRSLMERVFRHECIYLAARGWDGELLGVLPLVRVRSLVFGHYLVSMPFLNYGGPLGSPEAVRALVDEASALARMERVKLLELRSRIPLAVPIPASHRKITLVLDLPKSADALMSRFSPKLRSQIRRPQKAGVTVRFGASEVEPFFSVFSRHMRDLGTPTQPLELFQSLADQFQDDCWFACAYYRDQPVAAGCGFRFGGEFEMTWASSLREYNVHSPNMLLYWECMRRAVNEGLTCFNFGRCSPGSGTHRFKLQWGSREVPLWWYGIPAGTGAITPSPQTGRFRWAPSLWRYLPASVATRIGPPIVRYIP